MTLGQALASERSINLNALRLLLAASVIISHAWPLAIGPNAPEPLEELTGLSLGGWAVGIFFFLSGMLIAASAERKSASAFWRARFQRIIPGLCVALLVTLMLAFASGATATFQQSMLWFMRAITLVSIEHRLPAAFADNPYPLVVNGPLWSLFYEVAAYAICWVFTCVFGARSAALLAVLGVVIVALHYNLNILPGRLSTFLPLFTAFALGVAAHVFRDRIRITPLVALVALTLATVLPLSFAMGFAAVGLVVLSLFLPAWQLKQDASFGLYIYGWPVSQTLVALAPGMAPVDLAIWTLIVTYPIAILSWHFVERPALPSHRALA